MSSKMSHLQTVADLTTKFKSDSVAMVEIDRMKHHVLARKHYSDRVSDFASSFFPAKTEPASQITIPTTADKNKTTTAILQVGWTILSSVSLFLVASWFLIFLPLLTRVKGREVWGWLSLNAIYFAVVGTIAWVAFIIPPIFGQPWINYCTYGLFQIIIMLGFVLYASRNK